jgi:hypothetical protein
MPITIKARVDYPEAIENPNQPGKLQWSLTALVKKNTSDAQTLTAAVKAAVAEHFKGKMPPGSWMPLRDGDEQLEGEFVKKHEAYRGHYYIRLKSGFEPAVFLASRERVKFDKVTSGDYVGVTVDLYPFRNKLTGLGAGLGTILWLAEGEGIGGGGAASVSTFDDFLKRADVAETVKGGDTPVDDLDF